MTGVERALAALTEKTPESILGIARSFVDRSGEIEALMADLVASSAEDPFFRPPFHPLSSEIHAGLLLYHNADLSIAIGVTGVDQLAAKKADQHSATSIGFTGITTLFRYVKAGGATISFWEAPPITGDFVAAKAGRARLVGRRRIEDGEEVLIDGRYQSFVIEHATSDIVFFQAMILAGAAPLTVEYDSGSRELIGASSTDEASSRVQTMVSLLRTMGRDDAVPAVMEALESPHFYARWHIMRELLAMDADAAEGPLRRMAASDPHPEVRAAARETLDLFFDLRDAAA